MYEQKYASYNHDGEASVAKILEEEAEKLYNKLAKEMVDEIINDYASNIASSSLSLLAGISQSGKVCNLGPDHDRCPGH